ncbi:MAG TPA: hypothetical protein VGM92_08125 [Candidatus Kapabacteria bacterium]|jgi:hypothetical protein
MIGRSPIGFDLSTVLRGEDGRPSEDDRLAEDGLLDEDGRPSEDDRLDEDDRLAEDGLPDEELLLIEEGLLELVLPDGDLLVSDFPAGRAVVRRPMEMTFFCPPVVDVREVLVVLRGAGMRKDKNDAGIRFRYSDRSFES